MTTRMGTTTASMTTSNTIAYMGIETESEPPPPPPPPVIVVVGMAPGVVASTLKIHEYLATVLIPAQRQTFIKGGFH